MMTIASVFRHPSRRPPSAKRVFGLDTGDAVSHPGGPLSDYDIEATNVRPAFEASLQFGLTEQEIEEAVGWQRRHLDRTGATVSGASTYRHMELMASRPRYPDFVLAAVRLHTASSLGVVGLACKSCATVGEAFACHQRYQHLTNRTAEYTASSGNGRVTVTETRFGAPRLGSILVSDYTMLVAIRLLRLIGAKPPTVLGAWSRRSAMPAEELAAYEDFLGAPVTVGAERAGVALTQESLTIPVIGADSELADYFAEVLRHTSPPVPSEPGVVEDVRRQIRARLVHGPPSAAVVARSLGLGQRTLQRRLHEHDMSYASVLEDTRRRIAESLLVENERSLAEIAYLLGYAEQSSFHRAFRRWHATTPAAYRHAKLSP